MNLSNPSTKSIFEWIQSAGDPRQHEDGPTHNETFDTTVSQPQKKPLNVTPPINLDHHTIHQPGLHDLHTRHDLCGGHHDHLSNSVNLQGDTTTPEISDSNPYARRPRRKTKAEKYEFKEAKVSKGHQGDPSKGGRKRKRQETSGIALLHRYSADNVVSKRLTLRPTSNLGLFGKGKASSPFKQKALSDLAFTEVKFYTQNPSKELTAEHNHHGKPRRETELSNDELSRFFAVKGIGKADSNVQSGRKLITRQPDNASKDVASLELDVPPFLEFGQPAQQRAKSTTKPKFVTPPGLLSGSSQSQNQLTWSLSPTTNRTKLRNPNPNGLTTTNLPDLFVAEPTKDQDRVAQEIGSPAKSSGQSPARKVATKDIPSKEPDKSDGFLKELAELVARWKSRQLPTNAETKLYNSISDSSGGEHASRRKVSPNIDVEYQYSAEQDKDKVESNEKQGQENCVLPRPSHGQTDGNRLDQGHGNPVSAVSGRSRESSMQHGSKQTAYDTRQILPQRAPSSGSNVALPWSAPPLRLTKMLSMPMQSIYEDQIQLDVANISSEPSRRHSIRDLVSRSSTPSPENTDMTSMYSSPFVASSRRDPEVQHHLNHGSSYLKEPYSVHQQSAPRQRPTSTHWTEMPQSSFHFPQSLLSNRVSRPQSRLSIASNPYNIDYDIAVPASRQARIFPSSSRYVPQSHPLEFDDTPKSITGTQQRPTQMNGFCHENVEPRNFWTPHKLY